MTKDEELAMDLALEALEKSTDNFPANVQHRKAITAIKQARSAPAQEPNEWLTGCPECGMDSGCDCDSGIWNPPAAPVQEPVAFFYPSQGFYWAKPTRIIAPVTVDVKPLPLYTAAQRQWVGLTDEQIDLFINGRGDEDDDDYVEPTGDGFGLTDADLVKLVRRAEAKLRSQNA